jgi:2-oxoglutarate dehydrogenase E1 component
MNRQITKQTANKFFESTSVFYDGNVAYVEDMLARFKSDPESVDADWQLWLGTLENKKNGNQESVNEVSEVSVQRAAQDSIGALKMIQAYRTRGHLHANLDPLHLNSPKDGEELHPSTYGFADHDWDRSIFIGSALGFQLTTVREILVLLRHTYCANIGYEYMHISDSAQRAWVQERVERPEKQIAFDHEAKREILKKLIEVKGYERYLDKKFTGTKRFGLDGAEATIPALEQILKSGTECGVREVVFGMAHRGRLNVLSQVIGKPHRAIFNEFKGGSFVPDEVEGSGDVKYHLGASSDREFNGKSVHVSLIANPSHLEIADPVVLGKVRAKQDQNGDRVERSTVLPLVIHGDAAFAGQGVVAECFGLSGLEGFRTGGSLHFIINNQIGFTTDPQYSRSSPYPSDLAKMIEAPIFHVNGDDPEAVVRVAKLAIEFRQAFHKPVVIDMFCFRFYGHNEGDEPAFTQPRMYQKIRAHPSTLEIYGERLIAEGVINQGEIERAKSEWVAHLDAEFEAAQSYRPHKSAWLDGRWTGLKTSRREPDEKPRGQTAVETEKLKAIGARLTAVPVGFNIHGTVQRFLDSRRKMFDSAEGLDWATAESLALGSLAAEGYPIRLSGQDSERGTFSQRHSVLIDQETSSRYSPLNHVSDGQAPCEIINSMLSEEAVLAFEYGYSLAEPNALVLWEAQFGDFANGAQVVFDQFISSGERKWLRMSGLVCLLPHGYDGQGPEHSSARLERFLQSSAEDNWQVANCTTPANYFHILRRQVKRDFRKPLILMTPKSLLRHRLCRSELASFSEGTSFQRILKDDAEVKRDVIRLVADAEIRRVVLCSGKMYYDLLEEREKRGLRNTYLLRVEELYPFPASEIAAELIRFKKADVVWCQEESKNMGAWSFIEPLLEEVLGCIKSTCIRVRYVGRAASASPATGVMSQHLDQLHKIMGNVFGT